MICLIPTHLRHLLHREVVHPQKVWILEATKILVLTAPYERFSHKLGSTAWQVWVSDHRPTFLSPCLPLPTALKVGSASMICHSLSNMIQLFPCGKNEGVDLARCSYWLYTWGIPSINQPANSKMPALCERDLCVRKQSGF